MRRFLVIFALLLSIGTSLAIPSPLSAPVSPVYANTIIVTNTNDVGPGSLRQALADAVPFDTITFNLAPNSIIYALSELSVNKPLVIDGSSAVNLTLSGAYMTRVIKAAAPITLISLTIAQGSDLTGQGGGLYAQSTAVLTDVVFANNTAIDGGGAYMSMSATISGGAFRDNSCWAYPCGGGGLNASGALVITGTEFINNTATLAGGGVKSWNPVTITRALFRNNSCSGDHCKGGGLLAAHGGTFDGVQFIGNSADLGGAFAQEWYNSATFVNCLFARNSARLGGAGLFFEDASTVDLKHATITGHRTGATSAVFFVQGALAIRNSILSNNTNSINNVAGSVTQSGNLFYGNTTDWVGSVTSAGQTLRSDPRFVDPAGDDYHVAFGSRAIDTAANLGVTTDLDGDPRPFGASPDIGADESTYVFVPTDFVYLPFAGYP